MVKTTLNIDRTVMQRLRGDAARRGTTMSDLLEAGLRRVLAKPAVADGRSPSPPPLPSWHGGRERVDIASRDDLYRVLEEE